mmetsp:Transcript_4756/g.11585  ORF Transcript_4756/g.11585 Transcript_4756/m.11585 type:complete len:380 (-) Transcript_4756:1166-2305(-)
MLEDLRLLAGDQMAQRVRKVFLVIMDQVLHVVVDPTHAVDSPAGAPSKPVHQREQQVGPLRAELRDDVRVPGEELLHAVVVPLPVRTNGKQIVQDGLRASHAATLQRPLQRRDTLRADLDQQQPSGTLAARGATDGLFQHPRGVNVNGLHDNRGALVDRRDQHLRDEAESPAEPLDGVGVLVLVVEDLDARGHEGPEELGRDRVAYMAEAERGDVIDHLPRIFEDLEGHLEHAVGDEVQASVGLLEVVLTHWCRGEELLVDGLANLEELILRHAVHHPGQGSLPNLGRTERLAEETLHVVPEPIPSNLVAGVPDLGQGAAQGGEHARLVLREVHGGGALALGDFEGQDLALLLQASRVRHVGHDVVERPEDLEHPSLAL